MTMSFDKLQRKIDSLKNPTVAGLDPLPEYIPEHIMRKHIAEKGETLAAAADAYFEFNRGLIDALCDVVPAVKPQSAYYELLGYEGIRALKKTADYAKSKGLYVIGDVKRGDIGSTAEAYAAAYLGGLKIGNSEFRPFDLDAVTVSAYLGSDGVKPFLDACVQYDKAIFVLVKTSNPSAAEFQDLISDGEKVYITLGGLMEKLSMDTLGEYGYTRIGAVAGATYPEDIKFLRERLRHTFFLVPGYGAQGGTADDVRCAFDKDGRGAIVNSSRAILCAWRKTGNNGLDFAEAARNEALDMRGKLRKAVY